MEHPDLIRTVIEALGLGVAGMIAWTFKDLKSEVAMMRGSVNTLNVKIAEILVNIRVHNERIKRLEDKES